MKKVALVLTAVILSVFIWSCGGADTNKNDSNKENKKTDNLTYQEKQLKRMKDVFHLSVPDQLAFIEVKIKNGEDKIVFKAENITGEDLAKVEEWYKNECQRFRDEGYKETVINDNKEMMGMVFNKFSYMKKTENSTATNWSWNSISLYSNYNADEKSYELTITL